MTQHDVWIAIAALTVISFAIKAVGPVALGGRELPHWADRMIVLLPAALLSALVVVQTFAHGKELVLDARAAGLAAAAIALWFRASVLIVLLVAAGTAAGLRALGVPARPAPPRTRSTRARGGCRPRGRGTARAARCRHRAR